MSTPFYNFPSDFPGISYAQGTVSVGTSATLICAIEGSDTGVLIQNNGAVAVFLGGSNVTSSGATQGFSLAAGASVTVPTYGGVLCKLYGIVASTTANVAFLHPTAAAPVA